MWRGLGDKKLSRLYLNLKQGHIVLCFVFIYGKINGNDVSFIMKMKDNT